MHYFSYKSVWIYVPISRIVLSLLLQVGLNILPRVGYVTRDKYLHAVLDLANLFHSLSQLHKYCHRQYHNYIHCSRWLHDPHCVTPDHKLSHILLSRLFIPFPVACVNSGVPCYVTVGSAVTSPRGRVAECWLACYRSSGTAGRGGGVLHSANTSQYFNYSQFGCWISEEGHFTSFNSKHLIIN
jgi:hypothetical protein